MDLTIFDVPVVESVIESYKVEQNNENALMVMMTGRLSKLSKEVEVILAKHGLIFDKHIYNMGGSTIDSKIKSLNKLLIEYLSVVDILLTDDRLEHIPIFEIWGAKQVESGRLTHFKINVVPAGRH